MPVVDCGKCGRVTNSACSNYWTVHRKDGKADGCYARYENGKWVKGCAYDSADQLTQEIVKSLFEDVPSGYRRG